MHQHEREQAIFENFFTVGKAPEPEKVIFDEIVESSAVEAHRHVIGVLTDENGNVIDEGSSDMERINSTSSRRNDDSSAVASQAVPFPRVERATSIRNMYAQHAMFKYKTPTGVVIPPTPHPKPNRFIASGRVNGGPVKRKENYRKRRVDPISYREIIDRIKAAKAEKSS